MIEHECPECGWSIESSDRLGGNEVVCPKCDSSVTVPLSKAQKKAMDQEDRGRQQAEEEARKSAEAQARKVAEPVAQSSAAWCNEAPERHNNPQHPAVSPKERADAETSTGGTPLEHKDGHFTPAGVSATCLLVLGSAATLICKGVIGLAFHVLILGVLSLAVYSLARRSKRAGFFVFGVLMFAAAVFDVGGAIYEYHVHRSVMDLYEQQQTGADVPVETNGNPTLDLGNGVTIELVRIEAGTFMMGSPKGETRLNDDEGPQHKVMLTKPFYMGVTEVTQAQWKAVMKTEPWKGESFVKAGADNAASYISWNNATAFCAALSKKIGRTVRLPSEAEWEYACRAGTTTAYSFGDDASKMDDYAWYEGNTDSKGEGYAHPVGQKKPNAWGLYDMHGNVCEWCEDWYGSYSETEEKDPTGSEVGTDRVLRGGSWLTYPHLCRAALRIKCGRGHRGYDSGFRVVVEVK